DGAIADELAIGAVDEAAHRHGAARQSVVEEQMAALVADAGDGTVAVDDEGQERGRGELADAARVQLPVGVDAGGAVEAAHDVEGQAEDSAGRVVDAGSGA